MKDTRRMKATAMRRRARRWLLVAGVGVVLALASSAGAQPQLLLSDLDHLKCYEVVKDPHRGPASVDLLNLQFDQQSRVESGCTVNTRAQFFCAPTAKQYVDEDGQFVGDDPLGERIESEFLCYKLTCPRNPTRQISILDQFGDRLISIRHAQLLCTPAHNLNPPPDLPCDEIVPGQPPTCGGFCAAGTCQPHPTEGVCRCL